MGTLELGTGLCLANPTSLWDNDTERRDMENGERRKLRRLDVEEYFKFFDELIGERNWTRRARAMGGGSASSVELPLCLLTKLELDS